MSYFSYEEERTAKENLGKAFNDIKWRHSSSYGFNRTQLDFRGVISPTRKLDNFKNEINDLIRYIEQEEKSCDNDLQRYCPDFYDSINNSRTAMWDAKKNSNKVEQEKIATERIAKAVENIDSYAKQKSQEISKGFYDGIKEHFGSISSHGLGRPWGTEIRQRIATATGLRNEVNSLLDLGLNSMANAKSVYLGEDFVKLIKADPEMKNVIAALETEIVRDIKSRAYMVPYIDAQKIDGSSISGSKSVQLGGRRSPGNMFEQLHFTLRHPTQSYARYPETWNVAMNALTWTIRSGSIRFIGTYHAVYNLYGFAFMWEMEFSIEDVFDLRPSSGQKIDFSGDSRNPAYDIITSVLGTLYHDIFGNTDNLKVRASWHDSGTSNIQQW